MTTLIFTGLTLIALLLCGGYLMSRMPGRSLQHPLAPLNAEQAALAKRLEQHIHTLSEEIGERHIWRPERLEAAAAYIDDAFRTMGLSPRAQAYTLEGRTVRNIEVVIGADDTAQETIVVGAHYDTVPGTPGANDNASGIAALIELARIWRERAPGISLRLVAFVNEEPPFFKTDAMGSRVYARMLQATGIRVRGMFSLETIGYYSSEPGSQRFPLPLLRLFYPDRGDFLAFVGNIRSRPLLQRSLESFRQARVFPSEGLVAPGALPGVDWSDHWSFWQNGWPAVMITDTAIFRDPHYHGRGDSVERLDYAAMARIVTGLDAMLIDLLARGEES